MTQFGLRDLSLVSRRSLRFAGTAKSPEEFALSRNLRRRHLSIGQKATIALEWADQLHLVPRSEDTQVHEAAIETSIRRREVSLLSGYDSFKAARKVSSKAFAV